MLEIKWDLIFFCFPAQKSTMLKKRESQPYVNSKFREKQQSAELQSFSLYIVESVKKESEWFCILTH